MHHLVNHLTHAILPFFEHWGYVLIFILLLLESIPLLGFIVPGAVLAIFAGVLVKTGSLHLLPVILIGTAGALTGDTLMYLFGKHYGYDFLKRHGKLFFLNESRLEKTRAMISGHRVKAIFLNRFVSVSRPIGPFVSGASHIPFILYVFYAGLAALVWVALHVVGGYIFGSGVDALSKYLSLILIAVVLLSISIFYSYKFINKNHTVFKKYHVYTLILNILSIFAFASTLEDVLDHEWISRLDRIINLWVGHIHNPALTSLMIHITNLADPVFLFVASLILIGVMLTKKAWYAALLSGCSLVSGVALMYVIKALTNIERPLSPLVDTLYASFPSGHATMITIFVILFVWTFDGLVTSRAGKIVFYSAGALVVVLVGMSRIYLRAHWFSDVLAGVALGVFTTTFFMLFLRGLIWSHGSLLHFFRKQTKPFVKD